MIRARLEEGDLQVGDQVEINVLWAAGFQRHSSSSPWGESPCRDSPDIPLQGVLRSEAQEYLTKRSAGTSASLQRVQRTKIRLSVVGSVGRQGFYQIPADVRADAISMLAAPRPMGLKKRIRAPGHHRNLDPGRAAGSDAPGSDALDQLSNLRAGDELVLDPRKRPGGVSFFTVVGAIGGPGLHRLLLRPNFLRDCARL